MTSKTFVVREYVGYSVWEWLVYLVNALVFMLFCEAISTMTRVFKPRLFLAQLL